MRKGYVFLLLMTAVVPALQSAPKSPAEMLAEIRKQARGLLEAEGTFTGEVACWQANYKADRFLEAWTETGEPEYLRAAVEYFEALLGKLHTSPDGFRGWVGPYVYDEEYSTDVPISDAILAVRMLRVAKVILLDEPDRFRDLHDAARRMVGFARKDVIEKWMARGTWKEDGPYGFFVTWPMMFEGRDLSKRVETRTKHDRLGYQFNKQTEMGLVTLLLWQITGEDAMRDVAVRIASLLKSRLTLWDDHYTWNYWEPIYPGDVWSVENGTLAHWVGTHPHRHYQINELEFSVACQQEGWVFDRTDMERFAATHDRVMWNGDLENPAWPRNSDAAVIEAATGSYSPPKIPPGREKAHAGRPWTPLAPWSEPLRKMLGGEPAQSVKMMLPFHPPQGANSSLKMAAVVPAQAAPGEPVMAICSARSGGEVAIDLIGPGGNPVREIFRGMPPKTWNVIAPFSTEGLQPGEYIVRFTKDGQSRDSLLWIGPGRSGPR